VSDTHPLVGKLEPETSGIGSSDAALYSIAISLKRLADVMTGPCNEYGETFAEAIYGGIARGMRDGRP
jgi:hypothetical protein